MKRFTYAMVMAVALIVMVSSFAFAGDEECAKKAEAKTANAECTTAEKAACARHRQDCQLPRLPAPSATTAEKAACASGATAKTAGCRVRDALCRQGCLQGCLRRHARVLRHRRRRWQGLLRQGRRRPAGQLRARRLPTTRPPPR